MAMERLEELIHDPLDKGDKNYVKLAYLHHMVGSTILNSQIKVDENKLRSKEVSNLDIMMREVQKVKADLIARGMITEIIDAS